MLKKIFLCLLLIIFFLGIPINGWLFTNTDFSGTWHWKGRWVTGTITSDGNRNITSELLTDEYGNPVTITDGNYTMNSDGTFSLQVTAEGKGTFEWQGAINQSGDVIVVSEYSEEYDEYYLNNLLKKGEKSFTNTDFFGTWHWKGRWATGMITSDGNGNIISGSVTDEYANPVTITDGNYTMNSDGTFSLQVTAEGKGTFEGQGAINQSGDIIVVSEYNEEYDEYYLNYLLKNYNITKVIGSSGDLIEIKDTSSEIYGVYCEVPAGALDSDTTISIDKIDNLPTFLSDKQLVGNVIHFGPTGLNFNSEITIGLIYPSSVSPRNLHAYSYNSLNKAWEEISISSIDEDKRIVRIETNHFSFYALGQTKINGDDGSSNGGNGDGGGSCFLNAIF